MNLKIGDVALISGVFFILNTFVQSIAAYFLWNWLMPDLFELPHLSFWNVIGLIILVKCFIGRGVIAINSGD